MRIHYYYTMWIYSKLKTKSKPADKTDRNQESLVISGTGKTWSYCALPNLISFLHFISPKIPCHWKFKSVHVSEVIRSSISFAHTRCVWVHTRRLEFVTFWIIDYIWLYLNYRFIHQFWHLKPCTESFHSVIELPVVFHAMI